MSSAIEPPKHQTSRTAFLFDLDGTLVDSVYQHVLAWREALEAAGIEFLAWRIPRRIGMSGALFAHALLRETGRRVTAEETARLQIHHAEAYARQMAPVFLGLRHDKKPSECTWSTRAVGTESSEAAPDATQGARPSETVQTGTIRHLFRTTGHHGRSTLIRANGGESTRDLRDQCRQRPRGHRR